MTNHNMASNNAAFPSTANNSAAFQATPQCGVPPVYPECAAYAEFRRDAAAFVALRDKLTIRLADIEDGIANAASQAAPQSAISGSLPMGTTYEEYRRDAAMFVSLGDQLTAQLAAAEERVINAASRARAQSANPGPSPMDAVHAECRRNVDMTASLGHEIFKRLALMEERITIGLAATQLGLTTERYAMEAKMTPQPDANEYSVIAVHRRLAAVETWLAESADSGYATSSAASAVPAESGAAD